MTAPSGDDNSGDRRPSDDLASADPFRRAKAALRLGKDATPQALDQLLALLADPEWPVVEAALKALRRYRDPRIVAAAQAVLRRKEYFRTFTRGPAIARAAARALRAQGEEGFQALLALLPEVQDDEIRGQIIIKQLAVVRDPQAIGPLIACFNSPVYEVANRAAAVMRHFGADAIPPLIAAMSTTDQSVYFHVAWALRWMGAAAVPALLDALRHSPDENIRAGAADVLDSPEAAKVAGVHEALGAALEDPDEDVRHMAMWSLGRLGDLRALETLLAEQPDPMHGNEPATTLAQMGNDAVQPLTAALEDQARPTYQRGNAARALGLIKDRRALESLIVVLGDDDEDVRLAAVSALGDLKDSRAVEPLLAALDDSSPTVRTQALRELATLDDDRAFDAIARFVREGEEADRSRFDVLYTLALYQGERALPVLREVALSSDFRRLQRVLFALSHLGAPGVSLLLEIGRDPQPERRYQTIRALEMAYRRSPDPRIAEFLFAVIQEIPDSDAARWMRYKTVKALADCGDPRAVGPLLEILHDPASDPGMKYSAAWALGELGDERALGALTAVYQASMVGEDGLNADRPPWSRYDFQDALLRAMAKIRARLGMT